MYNAKIIKYVILFCREIVGCVERWQNINWIPQKYRPVWFVERSLVVFSK